MLDALINLTSTYNLGGFTAVSTSNALLTIFFGFFAIVLFGGFVYTVWCGRKGYSGISWGAAILFGVSCLMCAFVALG